MFYGFDSSDRVFNVNMRRWRFWAMAYYALTIAVLIAAPLLAVWTARFVTPESLDTRFVRATIGSWERAYFICVLFIFALIEFMGWIMVTAHKEVKNPDQRAVSVLNELAAKAGIPVPRFVHLENASRINAGAARSFFFGRKVLLVGDTSKLSLEQLRAVLAHEMAHLVMRDVRTGHVLTALRFAARVLNVCITVAFLATLVYRNFELTWFLAVANVITLYGNSAAKYLALAYSRVCEYRADAIAVQLTTTEHRKHLISALKRVSDLSLLVLLKNRERTGIDFHKTHPTLRKRARSLGLELRKKLALQIWSRQT